MNYMGLASTDCYKIGHPFMYRADTDYIESNLTARSDRLFPGNEDDFDHKMVVFGAQAYALEALIAGFKDFFRTVKTIAVAEYQMDCDATFGPGVITTKHIEALWDLQYLPLEIRSLPEGSRVPMGVPYMSIRNTVKGFGWLVNNIESNISAYTWKMSTNATLAFEIRRTFEKYADITGADKSLIPIQGHDFSFRGMSGPEDGTRSGAAHLLSFIGSDTFKCNRFVKAFYPGSTDGMPIMVSVPATEHSVTSSNIMYIKEVLDDQGQYKDVESGRFGWDNRKLAEYCFIKDMCERFPTGIFSNVTDTYDYFAIVSEVLPKLKKEILARTEDANGLCKYVVRPDSGDPEDIICGTVFYDDDAATPEEKGTLRLLGDAFGYTVNEKGYKVLNPKVGLIYGDSITLKRQKSILEKMELMGWASSNVVFGIGSYSYQYATRDTFSIAMKATHTTVGGKGIDLYKDPKTGSSKKSAKGRVRVEKVNGEYVLFDQQTEEDMASKPNELRVIFRNGEMVLTEPFDILRQRLASEL